MIVSTATRASLTGVLRSLLSETDILTQSSGVSRRAGILGMTTIAAMLANFATTSLRSRMKVVDVVLVVPLVFRTFGSR